LDWLFRAFGRYGSEFSGDEFPGLFEGIENLGRVMLVVEVLANHGVGKVFIDKKFLKVLGFAEE
jgi:hypothetical protein